jgi:uncharacterized protein DUF2846
MFINENICRFSSLASISMRRWLLFTLLCGSVLAPSGGNAAEKRVAPLDSVPDKAVIYIVRQPMDSWEPGMISLDGNQQITTQRGTYYRWEVAPGPHQIAGYAGASGSVKLSTVAGKIYFVRHTVITGRPAGSVTTQLRAISEKDGRKLVAQSQLLK